MAIKTKKISDLDEIGLTNVVLLGCQNGTTGKIPYAVITADVEKLIDEKLADSNLVQTVALTKTKMSEVDQVNDSVTDVQQKIETLKSENTDLRNKCKELSDRLIAQSNQLNTAILDCQNTVSKVYADTNKIISFIKDLQKDGYLTLAEIKKAAANAFHASTEE